MTIAMRSPMGLSPRQAQTLAFIRSCASASGVAPSYAEIAIGIGVKSRSNVHRAVHALIERGYLRQLPNRRHSLALVEPGLAGDTEGVLAFIAKRTGKSRDQLVAQAVDEFLLRQVQS